jgi:hypothetical protein
MICSSGWSAMALHSRCLALMMVRLRLLHVIDKCSFNCSGRDYLCDETPEKNDELAHRGRLSKNKKQTPPPWMVWTLMRQLECGIACPSPRERATNHKTVTVSSASPSAYDNRKSMKGRDDYVQAYGGNEGMITCVMILPSPTNYVVNMPPRYDWSTMMMKSDESAWRKRRHCPQRALHQIPVGGRSGLQTLQCDAEKKHARNGS